MERRKFIIGAGSLAAGGAAAIGSGAFSSVSADRDINVNVAGDESAYLGLESTSAYSSQNGKKLALEFDGSNSQNGDGLNADADTQFRNVFKVVNQGKNAIRFQFYHGDFNTLEGTPLAMAVSDETIEYASINEITAVNTSDAPGTWSGGSPAVADAQDIEPGAKSYVHVGFFLNDDNETLGHSNTHISDVPDDLTVYAEALPEDGTI
ncbi:hypothetical protein [Halobacteriaceae bacterium SHR40]|uniref:hypothetical protein n=1 Tax=Halovenus amylolytica TaxID=2500550 RepID=UPI000FE2E4B5